MIKTLGILDNIILILYFIIVLVIGLYFSRKNEKSSEDYFLAGRNLGWLAIGISLFATNISSEHFLGLALSGASKGFVVGQFEWLAVVALFMLGWIFAPVLIESKVFTTPEFLGKRFDNRARNYLTTVSIIIYVLTKISVTLFAGGLLLSEVLGWNMFASVVIMVLLTGVYTVIGGMTSVVYTQIFQTILIIVGSTLLTGYGFYEIGGWSGLVNGLPEEYFSVFRPINDPDFPWTGILLGAPIIGIWYWCTDQFMVQRILAAKCVNNARKGALLAAFLKILPMFILLLPGLIAIVLYPGVDSLNAFAVMISGDLLPTGIKGLVISGLFAALMSSLASVFNSTSALFTIDIYKRINKNASDDNAVLFGRLITTFIVLAAILWIPLLKLMNSDLYLYLQGIQAYIAPPIAAVFLIGIFWKKANSDGVFWTFLVGGSIGFMMIILMILNNFNMISNSIVDSLININFLHFAILLFLISSSILVIVSLVTNKNVTIMKEEYLLQLKSIFKIHKIDSKEYVYSVILILMVISLWGIFV